MPDESKSRKLTDADKERLLSLLEQEGSDNEPSEESETTETDRDTTEEIIVFRGSADKFLERFTSAKTTDANTGQEDTQESEEGTQETEPSTPSKTEPQSNGLSKHRYFGNK